jgi:hypothetical protein
VNSARFDQAERLKSGIPRVLIKPCVLVDAARSYHPFAFLSGHRSYAIKVRVVMQNDQAGIFGRRGD